MRAAQTALRRPGLPMLRPAVERPHREHTPQTESGAALAFGVIFLAGYLPGIWLGRSGTTPLGQQLAAYYTSRPEGTSLAAAFGAQLAVSLLQLTLVLLCGFCVWGVGLLALLFAARGLFLGYCAARWQRKAVRRLCCAIGWIRCFLMWVRCFSACGWQAGQCGWRWNFSARCAGVLHGRHRAQRGGWQSVLPRRWRCQRLSLPSGLYSPSWGSGASGADGFCSTYFWVASGEAATAFFSCSRLMWV